MGTRRHIQSFTAIGDDGQEYVLHVYQDVNSSAATRADPRREVLSMKAMETEDGLSVNRTSKGVYQVVTTGMVLRSDDPAAP